MQQRKFFALLASASVVWLLTTRLSAADYKPEFKMSVVVNEDTSWGRAANRFADAVRFRTRGRIKIKNYFEGRLYTGEQTTEFKLLQDGTADFAIGTTVNWSPQVKELNLFMLPFLFSNYAALDAVESGEPGKRLFKLIEEKGVVPIAWGESGFREVTNSTRAIRRPDDLQGLKIRVPPVPIIVDIFHTLGALPVTMNWDQAQVAFQRDTVDGQENPVSLIIPYKLWAVHKYVTLWHYAIDPLILAVSAKTWATLTPEDQNILQRVGEEIMEEQKKEAREGLTDAAPLVDSLEKIYQMEVTRISSADIEAFRVKTKLVYDKWARDIGLEIVSGAENLAKIGKSK
jgi:tripartite ATP-independent transporter DctP family solute receptor